MSHTSPACFLEQYLSLPFILGNPSVGHVWDTFGSRAEPTNSSVAITGWGGSLPPSDYAYWADCMLLLVFGGIPWQVHFGVTNVHCTVVQ